ncbi:MAG: hypothetical protein AAF214_05380 [Pseudomonadota bacterium]
MDYTARITTSAPVERAARALLDDLELWWSTRIERTATGFTTRFNNSHATFAVDPQPSPGRSVWTCTDAHMIMDGVEDAAEWVATKLIWDIAKDPRGSVVTLTHQGLSPALPCFDICQRGWQHFFETSLRDHLNGHGGSPNTT